MSCRRRNLRSGHGFLLLSRPTGAMLLTTALAFYSAIPYSVITVIRNFSNKVAREIWESDCSKALPRELWTRAKALLTIMHATSVLEDLKIKGQPPNIRLHKLKGGRRDEWSVTIQLPWCITFKFHAGEFSDVKIENYHRG